VELNPGVIITVAVALVATVLLIRWGRRNEAPPVGDTSSPPPPVRSHTTKTRDERANNELVHWVLDRAFEETGVRVAEDPLACQRIAQAVLKAMEDLRTNGSAEISLPFLVADAQGPKHLNLRLKQNLDSTFELER
jgi:hypothetical protein